jgi:hypothetical protein
MHTYDDETMRSMLERADFNNIAITHTTQAEPLQLIRASR